METKPNIVILGGGFGGVRCALDLAKKLKGEASITLIDKNNYHFFTPALYEVASAYHMEEDPYYMRLRKAIAVPYSQIFKDKGVNLIQAEITSVDMIQSHVVLDGGEQVDFSHLVFALGSQASDFGIPGVYEYTYQFKTTDDAVALNKKLEELFSDAADGMVPMPIKFLVIGAGFTGIELASELVMCARKLCERYKLEPRAFNVTIFEATPKILPMIEDEERKKIMRRLTEIGVIIMENSAIESVMSDSVKLKTGVTVPGTVVVWTAGVQANTLAVQVHGLPVTPKGKIMVDQYLRAQGFENIFALGDVMEFTDPKTQKPIPGLAYTAKVQGSIVAQNLAAEIKGKKLKAYKPKYDQWIAPVGGKYAVAHISQGMTWYGMWGWFARNFSDLRYFLSILPFKQAIALFQKDLMIFSRND